MIQMSVWQYLIATISLSVLIALIMVHTIFFILYCSASKRNDYMTEKYLLKKIINDFMFVSNIILLTSLIVWVLLQV